MSAIAGKTVMKTFPAELEELYAMLGFVKEQARALSMHPSHIIKIELALEEALVNVMTYGYPHQKGTLEISCSPAQKLGIKIVVKDHGIPYNPLAQANKIMAALPQEGQILGGYGIYFILKIMDETEYHREDECNFLTLIKYNS
ncbi:MAG: ATP-binding protein [Parachlamydia sp.]|nr:MAG: ATP-binding protein [Parachlamydia sp.]